MPDTEENTPDYSDIEYDDDSYDEEYDDVEGIEFEDDDNIFPEDDEDDGDDGSLPLVGRSGYLNGNFQQRNLDYRSMRLSELIDRFFIQKAVALHEGQLPQCSIDDLLIMLQYKNWQSDDVINDYYDNWPKLRDACGLPSDQYTAASGLKSVKDFTCDICVETYTQTEIYSLACGHEYCVSCYGQYIDVECSNPKLIRCMHYKCHLTVPHKDIDLITGHDHISGIKIEKKANCNPLLITVAKSYIDSHSKQFKWCPAVDCHNLVEFERNDYDDYEDNYQEQLHQEIEELHMNDKDLQVNGNLNDNLIHEKRHKQDFNLFHITNVVCLDNHEFCYTCQRENHLPCPCSIVDLWIQKCKDDSETANWIQANTQACPKCDSLIEKSGGCNHMTCKKCLYEFCWICLGEWKLHGRQFFQCNRFDPEAVDSVKRSQQSKRLSLQRYLHFYSRFAVHESSMKGDQRVIDKVDHKMKIYMDERQKLGQDEDLSWTDIQFLHDAIKALTNGRKSLKWTYCFAFYLDKSNFSEIFESMQDYLNKTVEDLSKIFEEINAKKNNTSSKTYHLITHYRSEIISLSSLVIKRQKLLIEFAQSGLEMGQLKFIC